MPTAIDSVQHGLLEVPESFYLYNYFRISDFVLRPQFSGLLRYNPRMIDLYNILLEKNAPDMMRAATVRAAMQNAQTLNVVRLKASQMLSASESEVTMV